MPTPKIFNQKPNARGNADVPKWHSTKAQAQGSQSEQMQVNQGNGQKMPYPH
jgi:hypothetical protein